jgi:hypothetical protein
LKPKLWNWTPSVPFDADVFHGTIGRWSRGEYHAALFILTVWNPIYAQQKGWVFDMVDAAATLDSANRAPILKWLEQPYYP